MRVEFIGGPQDGKVYNISVYGHRLPGYYEFAQIEPPMVSCNLQPVRPFLPRYRYRLQRYTNGEYCYTYIQ